MTSSSRWLLLVGGLALGFLIAQAQSRTSLPVSLTTLLKTSRWQKRVLLLCAPTATDLALLRQQQLLAPVGAGLAARDLLVHEVILSRLSTADRKYLADNMRVATGAFTVLLVGKDGGVKRRESQPVTPASLFSTIDGMPMRQQEIHSAKRP